MNFVNICAGKNSNELKDIVDAYIPARESSLRMLIELKEKIGEAGIDLF